MKKLLLPFCLLVIFSACEIDSSENKDGSFKLTPTEDLKGLGEKLEKTIKEQSAKNKERKQSGDTVALHFNELEKFLPDIPGFQRDGEADGEVNRAMGVSFSQSSQKYTSGDGRSIEVSIVDYLGASALYSLAAMAFEADIYRETKKEIIRKTDLGIDNVMGLEKLDKNRKSAEITLGAGSRFLISIEGKNMEDLEALQLAAKKMPLKEMAER